MTGHPLIEKGSRLYKGCNLEGHCVEGDYGLVSESGETFLLDSEATPMVLNAVQQSTRERGIKLRAYRESRDGEMQTTRVELL